MRKWVSLGVAGLFGLLILFGWPYVNNLLGAGTGIVAKTVCSGIFVAGRDETAVIAEDTNHYPDIFEFSINSLEKKVKVKAGWREGLAQYFPGTGCIRLADSSSTPLDWLPQQPSGSASLAPSVALPEPSWPVGGLPDEQLLQGLDRAQLQRAVGAAFADADAEVSAQTRAVAVVWRGQLIAERYAEGFSKTTPLMGWSMSKSITNALIGMRIGDGALALTNKQLLPQWQDEGDPRAEITLDALLRMSSGLNFSENYFDTGSDAVTMLFGNAGNDMAGFAANQPLEHPVDTHWSYSSGTTNLLQRILHNSFGSTREYQNYLQQRLLEPLGMQRTLIEPDASGTFVGSSFGYATARDWARFGLLFLQDGVWQQQRLLPEGWVDYSTTPTHTAEEGNYGAHWWLNHDPKDGASTRAWPKLPQSAYRASGFEGQTVMVLPSHDLVVVRLGLTVYPATFDLEGFVVGIIDALPAKEPIVAKTSPAH